HGAHIVGRQVQRSPVDGLGGQHPERNSVVAQHLLNAACGFGRLVTAGVHHQQHGTFSGLFRNHSGPSSTARRTASTIPSADSPRSVSARSHKKYSTLPDGPGSGLAVTSTVCQPSSPARRATPSTASARRPGSWTTPPAP